MPPELISQQCETWTCPNRTSLGHLGTSPEMQMLSQSGLTWTSFHRARIMPLIQMWTRRKFARYLVGDCSSSSCSTVDVMIEDDVLPRAESLCQSIRSKYDLRNVAQCRKDLKQLATLWPSVPVIARLLYQSRQGKTQDLEWMEGTVRELLRAGFDANVPFKGWSPQWF